MSKYIQILSKYALFTIAAEKKRPTRGHNSLFLFMSSLQIACINTKCPHRSPGITKNPRYGHLVFILFSQVLKKASAQPPTKLRSTHSTQQLIHLIHSTTPTVSFIRSTSTTAFILFIQLRSFHSFDFTRSTAPTLHCSMHFVHSTVPSSQRFHSLRSLIPFSSLYSFHSLVVSVSLTHSP